MATAAVDGMLMRPEGLRRTGVVPGSKRTARINSTVNNLSLKSARTFKFIFGSGEANVGIVPGSMSIIAKCTANMGDNAKTNIANDAGIALSEEASSMLFDTCTVKLSNQRVYGTNADEMGLCRHIKDRFYFDADHPTKPLAYRHVNASNLNYGKAENTAALGYWNTSVIFAGNEFNLTVPLDHINIFSQSNTILPSIFPIEIALRTINNQDLLFQCDDAVVVAPEVVMIDCQLVYDTVELEDATAIAFSQTLVRSNLSFTTTGYRGMRMGVMAQGATLFESEQIVLRTIPDEMYFFWINQDHYNGTTAGYKGQSRYLHNFAGSRMTLRDGSSRLIAELNDTDTFVGRQEQLHDQYKLYISAGSVGSAFTVDSMVFANSTSLGGMDTFVVAAPDIYNNGVDVDRNITLRLAAHSDVPIQNSLIGFVVWKQTTILEINLDSVTTGIIIN